MTPANELAAFLRGMPKNEKFARRLHRTPTRELEAYAAIRALVALIDDLRPWAERAVHRHFGWVPGMTDNEVTLAARAVVEALKEASCTP